MCDQTGLEPACSTTETSWGIWISDITTTGHSRYVDLAYLDTTTYVEVTFHSQHFFLYISLLFNSVYVENS